MDEKSDFLPNLTVAYGIVLTLWGLIVTGISESQSISSFAPAFFGLPLLVSGEMARTPGGNRKLWRRLPCLCCSLQEVRIQLSAFARLLQHEKPEKTQMRAD